MRRKPGKTLLKKLQAEDEKRIRENKELVITLLGKISAEDDIKKCKESADILDALVRNI